MSLEECICKYDNKTYLKIENYHIKHFTNYANSKNVSLGYLITEFIKKYSTRKDLLEALEGLDNKKTIHTDIKDESKHSSNDNIIRTKHGYTIVYKEGYKDYLCCPLCGYRKVPMSFANCPHCGYGFY